MRTGGLISDLLGEVRIAEVKLLEAPFLGAGRVVTWKSGRFEMGYPLGMPLGVDSGVSFQIYGADGLLEGTGATQAAVSVDLGKMNWLEVIGVATHLRGVDQSNVSEWRPGRKVRLSWPASASSDVASYRIYCDNADGMVDYDTPVGEVEAKPLGVAPASYAWTSDEMTGGSWTFGVRAVDEAGNEVTGPAREATVRLTPAPYPPRLLACAYDADSGLATLTWTPPDKWI